MYDQKQILNTLSRSFEFNIQSNNVLQRKCEACEEEEFQMKPLEESLIQMKSSEKVILQRKIQMRSIEEEEEILQPKLRLQPIEKEDEETVQLKQAGVSFFYPNLIPTAPDKIRISENGSPSIQLEEQPTAPENDVTTTQPVESAVNQVAGQPQVCGGTLPASELQRRDSILADFTREFTINEVLRNVLNSSLCDFSINQLTQMQAAGLRVWSHGTLPPVFANDDIEVAHGQGGSASYVPPIRTIFIRRRVNSGYLTHEMAHAWDHIRNLPARNRVRLDSLNSRRRRRLIQQPGRFYTATNRRHNVNTGGTRLTFQQMFDNYRSRVSRRELAFARAAREGYSMRSVQEFYAEGYAVFHGISEYEQAKIYKYAREFYTFLQGEAVTESMPVPNLTNIQAEARRLPAPR